LSTPAVRWATEADIPELVRVINAAYRVEDFFKTGDRTHAADAREHLGRVGAGFLVIDGAQPGTLAGSVFVERRGERGYFGMLSVDPARQGEGLSRVLIGAVEQHFTKAGCTHLDITVVNLRTELPPFYAKFGFAVSGAIPFAPPEELRREAHLVVMSKRLGKARLA
jgi:GNAT superfamily N-acetyltransferase